MLLIVAVGATGPLGLLTDRTGMAVCITLLRFATARRKSHWSGGAEGVCNDESFCVFVVLGADHRP